MNFVDWYGMKKLDWKGVMLGGDCEAELLCGAEFQTGQKGPGCCTPSPLPCDFSQNCLSTTCAAFEDMPRGVTQTDCRA
jgi:hypothetical protein